MNAMDQPPGSPGAMQERSSLRFSPYRVFSREEWAKLRAEHR